MGFDRRNLPDPVSYFESEGLKLTGPGKWKTTRCIFHDGSDSMRINTATGGWCCMASCGAKGGDVLSYHMQATGQEFVDACKSLGCWVDDGRPVAQHKPAPLSPRQALEVLAVECNLVAIAAANVAHGVVLSQVDLSRVLMASGRISRLAEVFG